MVAASMASMIRSACGRGSSAGRHLIWGDTLDAHPRTLQVTNRRGGHAGGIRHTAIVRIRVCPTAFLVRWMVLAEALAKVLAPEAIERAASGDEEREGE